MRVHLIAASLVASIAQQIAPPAAPSAQTDPGALTVAVTARAMQPGEVARLDISSTRPVTALNVRAFDRDIAAARVGRNRWRALVGIDLDVKPGNHPVTIDATFEDGGASQFEILAVEAK